MTASSPLRRTVAVLASLAAAGAGAGKRVGPLRDGAADSAVVRDADAASAAQAPSGDVPDPEQER